MRVTVGARRSGILQRSGRGGPDCLVGGVLDVGLALPPASPSRSGSSFVFDLFGVLSALPLGLMSSSAGCRLAARRCSIVAALSTEPAEGRTGSPSSAAIG